MNYYPFHLGDYATHTGHLDHMEDLAYRRMLDAYYLREKPLPSEVSAVARLIRMRDSKDAIEAVLTEFFELRDDGWHQERCNQEITSMREKQAGNEARDEHEKERMRRHRERRAEMFAILRERGVVPAWDVGMKELQRLVNDNGNEPATHLQREQVRDGNGPATAIPIPTPTPTPIYKENTPLPPKGGLHRFDEFWKAWPKSERKHDKVKCAKKWRENGLDDFVEQILADIEVKRHTEKWRGGFIEAPLVYLNGRRWEDGAEPESANQGSMWAGAV